MPARIDLESAIARAIKKTCFTMLKTLAPFIGVRAIRYLARRLRHLRQASSDPLYPLLYVGTIVRRRR
jgi:hypothetical protein